VLNQLGQPSPLPRGETAWAVEIALDVEIAHEICQDCRINLYEADDAEMVNLETAVDTAVAQGANAISNSYGIPGVDCEDPHYDHPNVAIAAAGGDHFFGIMCPAVQSSVISVGGTTLNLDPNGDYGSETLWSETGLSARR